MGGEEERNHELSASQIPGTVIIALHVLSHPQQPCTVGSTGPIWQIRKLGLGLREFQ